MRKGAESAEMVDGERKEVDAGLIQSANGLSVGGGGGLTAHKLVLRAPLVCSKKGVTQVEQTRRKRRRRFGNSNVNGEVVVGGRAALGRGGRK